MEAFAAADISYELKPKDGTFYAPKIDIYIDDALGREWQMATIQIDLTMLPEQFDLTYDDENGKLVRPIAIHRAIYGSLERFIGILIEHFGGAFPLWIAPVQAVVIPIADRHLEPAEELAGVLRVARPARRGRHLGRPDAEQDPARAGAEDPVHARARRPRDRGADGGAPHAGGRAAARRGLGCPGGPPRRGGGRQGRIGSQAGASSSQIVLRKSRGRGQSLETNSGPVLRLKRAAAYAAARHGAARRCEVDVPVLHDPDDVRS